VNYEYPLSWKFKVFPDKSSKKVSNQVDCQLNITAGPVKLGQERFSHTHPSQCKLCLLLYDKCLCIAHLYVHIILYAGMFSTCNPFVVGQSILNFSGRYRSLIVLTEVLIRQYYVVDY